MVEPGTPRWPKHIQNDVRFFIGSTRGVHEASVALVSAVLKSDRETFAAGAVGDSVRIGDFEASFLEILAVV